MEYGELITKFRKEASLTLDELSEKSGVPKGTINKIIGGVTKAPTLPNMKAIAKAMGKTLADFDDPPPETKNAPSYRDRAILDKMHQLSDLGQDQVIDFADTLVKSGKFPKEPARDENAM